MNKQIPINSSMVRLYINNEGDVDGDLMWNCAENLEQEYVDALVEATYGLMAMITTDFEKVREMGRAFQSGQAAAMADDEGKIYFEPEADEEQSHKNVVSFNPSTRKH